MCRDGTRKDKAQLELEAFQGRLWSKSPWKPWYGYMKEMMMTGKIQHGFTKGKLCPTIPVAF